jgi:hypothetical protein
MSTYLRIVVLLLSFTLCAPSLGHGQSKDTSAKAKRYFARLVQIAGQGDARPELAQARTFLAANP